MYNNHIVKMSRHTRGLHSRTDGQSSVFHLQNVSSAHELNFHDEWPVPQT